MPDITSNEGIPFSRGGTMSSRILRSLILTAGALVGLACGDYSRSTSPVSYNPKLLPPTLTVRASYTLLSSGTKARAVKWGSNHSRVEQSVSAVIGPDGGTLSLPGSDLTMVVPNGALAAPTTITIVGKGGAYVAYEMLPHGLRFLKPVTAVQGLQNTALYGTDAGNSIRAAYLPEGRDAIGADDSASPSELQAATTYFYGAKPVAETQAWIINHFSRYILISNVWVLVNNDG
jgi:ZU5 domain